MGAVLLGVAIWIKADGGLWEYTDNMDIERYSYACYICMTAGALILIVGFLGCLGAAMESPCMLLAVSLKLVLIRNYSTRLKSLRYLQLILKRL